MAAEASPYTGVTPVPPHSTTPGTVNLVESQTFCLSGRSGDVAEDLPHGLFVLDTRVLSRWALRLNGHAIEPLAVQQDSPFDATFIAHGAPAVGRADADVVVFRHRHIGMGMRERLLVVNHGLEPTTLLVELHCDVDFGDLFEVKEGHIRPRGRSSEVSRGSLVFSQDDKGVHKSVTVASTIPADAAIGLLRWQLTLPPKVPWEVCLDVRVALDGRTITPRFGCTEDDHTAVPTRRMAAWQAALPTVTTDCEPLADALARSAEDLGALRIFDPEHPEVPIVAAGAPWFMTLFGRDSLLTAWMTLIADPSLARGVLETLARFQGRVVNPDREEEPGKILHEMRFGGASGLAFGGGTVYFGSIDATPLFVMLLGELQRWDPNPEVVDHLLPHADRALDWIERFGDRDGDGYVEYERQVDWGLANQGWKDSWDAIRHRDGDLATAPIALCEVQGYVYAAYLARADLAATVGDDATSQRYREKARVLRQRFNDDFWLEEDGWYAMALDGDKRPVTALASNIGHCLWTGIVDPDRAGLVADRLLSPQLFSGFGVRTLASSMRAYNPISYHNGSVWPHDNAICAAGLARYGHVDAALRIIGAQLEVARSLGGRLPELFAGFGRAEVSAPASYPTSCSPQAWAAAAPLLWLRTMLGLDPGAGGHVRMAPQLPDGVGRLSVAGLRVGGRELTVSVDGGHVAVSDAGTSARHDLTFGPSPDRHDGGRLS